METPRKHDHPSPPLSRDWHRDGYLISTRRQLIQADALSAALDSDLMWWAKPVPDDALETMLDNSLSFGLYKLPESAASPDISSPSPGPMVGYARLVTDYVSFAFLTDVYVLPEHQGRGLAAWMMRCLDEVLDSWPHLRRVLLVTGSPRANRLYEKTIGAVEWNKSSGRTVDLLEKLGGSAGQPPGRT